jgi:hypothetical protein
MVKPRAEDSGLDPGPLSGHSLRAGLATSAAAAGSEERDIQKQTCHQSVGQKAPTKLGRYSLRPPVYRAQDHPAPPLDASPKRRSTLTGDGPETPLHSPPIGLKSFDGGHGALIRIKIAVMNASPNSGIILRGIRYCPIR